MRPMTNFYRLLSDDEVDILHEKALKILEEPGMKIENRTMLEALKKKGAKVDLEGEIAKIPPGLMEEFIGMARRDEINRVEKKDKDCKDCCVTNWATPPPRRVAARVVVAAAPCW